MVLWLRGGGGGGGDVDEDSSGGVGDEVTMAARWQGLVADICKVRRFISDEANECAPMSMGRASRTRLQRRGAKQSGEIDIEFKIADEYTVKWRADDIGEDVRSGWQVSVKVEAVVTAEVVAYMAAWGGTEYG
ncbi:hypothetical protein Tco_0045253 [Tanacetum coccineum]